jgi:poly(3-hydroxybutyrate) depolymerase
MRAHYMQPAVGHYGVFNGSRFRAEIVPRIADFITSYGRENRAPARPRLVRAAKG